MDLPRIKKIEKKSIKKILFFLFAIILLAPVVVSAYEVEIPIGDAAQTFTLPLYIVTVHKFAVILAAILAVIFMMIGGFMWLASAGNSGMVSTGQNFIKGSIIGLILTLFSWYILYAINPNLVKLSIKQPTITIPWCCQNNQTNVYSLSAETNPQSCPDGSTPEKDSSKCDQLLVCCQSTIPNNPPFTSLISCPPAHTSIEMKNCEPASSCTNSATCLEGEACVNSYCVKTQKKNECCVNDTQCDPSAPQCVSSAEECGLVCDTGVAGAFCVNSNDCNNGYYCNNEMFGNTCKLKMGDAGPCTGEIDSCEDGLSCYAEQCSASKTCDEIQTYFTQYDDMKSACESTRGCTFGGSYYNPTCTSS